MAKRFTDTEKYKKPFYRKLPGAYKLLWDFICHDCDHAGIWHVDKEIAEIYIGRDMEFDLDIALKLFNDGEKRVEIINDGSKWFIRTFIEFQYGELNPSNRVHFSILAILKKNKIKPLISPLKGAKYKDKDKDKDKDFLGEFPELNLDAWERWIAYKKKIKDPYKTENGERTKIKALIKLSDGGMSLQDKIVTQAIDEEWKGLYALKGEDNGSGRQAYQPKPTSADRAAAKLLELAEAGPHGGGHT